ncbi:o-succinylbenzoate--CoA ligase [Ureibacillus thermophilus]|uniref:O-succinylbenzoate--CoA ligase n=1 Tax=Ureibacillus thermophilus TaxID=367743 RepID=A0A4P6UUT0_9BACL|nr:o-succinylbenzoate--CoA ligase [Ureibacillus thermophilus]QBK26325.1 o-succinylbenzoate--CoA ligase [Ureibacillus thermophilus]
MNIGQILASRSILQGEKVGFIRNDVQLTFHEMNERANSFAQFLQQEGIKAGDKIALLCKNNEHVVAAFFCAAKIGVVTVVLNYRLHTEELQYIITHSDAKLLVYDEVFEETAKQLPVAAIGTNKLIDIYKQKAAEPQYVTHDNEPILMMYTSGTTGKPKGALISHNNLQAASIGLTHTIDWWEQDRFLMVAPFFHIGGFAPLITNVHVGATMILMEDFHPVEAWKAIERHQITTMMSVPAMLAFMLKTYPSVKTDISSIRNISCGASAVPAPLILGFRQLGIPIQQVYGMTEFTGAITFWKESQNKDKYKSMGKPVMQAGLRIVDIETKEAVQQGKIGEIVLSGPQVFVGYYKDEESYKKTVQNGELYTGDVGYIDEEGFLYVVDRLKDMIISGGENIYPAEIEAVISEHPAVQEVAVVGKPDEKWGEVPRAFIVKKEGAEVTEEEIIAFTKEHLASFKTVKEVVFLNQLPRNAVGKIIKSKFAEEKNPV